MTGIIERTCRNHGKAKPEGKAYPRKTVTESGFPGDMALPGPQTYREYALPKPEVYRGLIAFTESSATLDQTGE